MSPYLPQVISAGDFEVSGLIFLNYSATRIFRKVRGTCSVDEFQLL